MLEVIDNSLLGSFEEYEKAHPEELLQIDSVLRLLGYCIETNRTFAVEYNPKEEEEEEGEEPNTQHE